MWGAPTTVGSGYRQVLSQTQLVAARAHILGSRPSVCRVVTGHISWRAPHTFLCSHQVGPVVKLVPAKRKSSEFW